MINMKPKYLLLFQGIVLLLVCTPLTLRYTSYGENTQSLRDFLGIAFMLLGFFLSALSSYALALMSQINGLSLQLDVLKAKISTLEQCDIEANLHANNERSRNL